MPENVTTARKSSFVLWLCATLVLAGLILWLSLIKVPQFPGLDLNDKVKHFLAYAALGLSVCSVISRAFVRQPRRYVVLAGICMATLYGISLEFAQALFTSDRECSVFDMIADLLGSAAGSGLWAAAGPMFVQIRIWRRA